MRVAIAGAGLAGLLLRQITSATQATPRCSTKPGDVLGGKGGGWQDEDGDCTRPVCNIFFGAYPPHIAPSCSAKTRAFEDRLQWKDTR